MPPGTDERCHQRCRGEAHRSPRNRSHWVCVPIWDLAPVPVFGEAGGIMFVSGRGGKYVEWSSSEVCSNGGG